MHYPKSLWLSFCMGIFLLSTCTSSAQKPPLPNILWISAEDIGPAWGCYGDTYADTPNIDLLAKSGYVFTKASSNTPICAPARSTLITGMYATSLGTQHLRSEVPVPNDLKILPELMRGHGYYTTNNVKTDYNFSPEGRWNESSTDAHWRNRAKGQPFFSVVNFMITHEGPTNNENPGSLTASLPKKHDPEKAPIPPYFPNTTKMTEIMAHAYDLISVFDQGVGNLVQELKEDGLYDDTIIFVFSDHGFGLPRHKRWLNNSGTQIPFVLHVPEKYKYLTENLKDNKIANLVGFVDFAPTILGLAGIPPSAYMQGINFLGKNAAKNDYTFGFRSRADDCFDMSRSISDGRYLYIRNYVPQLPYIQKAIIFTKAKKAMEEIYRSRSTSPPLGEMEPYFHPKPVIELYDLDEDPFEMNNIAENPEQRLRVDAFQEKLEDWMLLHRDSGMLNESEYMIMSKGSSVYETLQKKESIYTEEIIDAMNQVGKGSKETIIDLLKNENPIVRYWGLLALEASGSNIEDSFSQLINLLTDTSSVNSILSARLLVDFNQDPTAYETLKKHLRSKEETVVLYAAIAVRLLGGKAAPLIPAIKEEIYPKFAGDIWGRYKNWSYPMFIGMALDQSRINCGEEIHIEF